MSVEVACKALFCFAFHALNDEREGVNVILFCCVAPSTVCFSNLTSLNVGECDGMVYLLTSSTAKSLSQLRRMYVRDCQAIEEIMGNDDEDDESNDEEIAFEQLSDISLASLPSIVGIYSETLKLKFPSLNHMKYSYVPHHLH
ncbi:uncharacterized protein HKW66_Vig0113470 [Vigna angularis]|uniref:Disease resistance protein At4g27190-like leucine-rich repeats domain-containing protein n=1 Tax=Phaseolus angularis TaxID=3914 RepID=A0A8T0L352_PHAAN|nr:uncharacterized protein HKW66_Vig0113470 [Vigna angularis]